MAEAPEEEDVASTSTNSQGCRQCIIKDAVIDTLEREIAALKIEIKYFNITLSYEQIKHSDTLVHLYTGLPNIKHFSIPFGLTDLFSVNYYNYWSVEKMRKVCQLLMTLMKLRRNDP